MSKQMEQKKKKYLKQNKKNTANTDKQKNTSAISSVDGNSFCGKKEKNKKSIKQISTTF